MKKSRNLALNHAVIALLVSSLVAFICYLFNINLTQKEYQIPFGLKNGTLYFFYLPKLGIRFFPVILTLLVFQISYLKQLMVSYKENCMDGYRFGLFFGIIVPILLILVNCNLFFPLPTVVGFVLILLTLEFSAKSTYAQVSYIVSCWTIYTFLFHIEGGVGVYETLSVTWNVFSLMLILALVTSAIIPLIIAILERIYLIIKVPELRGEERASPIIHPVNKEE